MSRPQGVPEGATFLADEKLWEHASMRGGVRHGLVTRWRQDGSKQADLRYKDGARHGPFKEFHDNGDLHREGNYRADELHGTEDICRRGDGQGPAPYDGVADAVFKSSVEYDMGRTLAVRHFDQSGQRVLPDGTAIPKRPKGLPSLAEYDADSGRWFHGPKSDDGQRTGLWMWWITGGTLVEESEFRDGHRQGVCRRYGDDGTLLEEGSYAEGKKSGTWSTFDPDDDGRLLKKADYDDDTFHGSYIEYGPDGRSRVRIEYESGRKTGQYLARIGKEKYEGGKIRVEKGHFKDDIPIGRWKLLDKGLKPVVTVDFGVPRSSEEKARAAEVFADATRPADAWSALAASLLEERIIGESLLACARSAAAAHDGSLLTAALEERSAPLSSRAADALAEEVLEDASDQFSALAGAMVRGAEPSRILQALAITLDRQGRPCAALDFIDAAMAIAPENRSLHYTRALVNISLGESEAALADAHALTDDEPDNARFLQAYVQALFPRYILWPHRDELKADLLSATASDASLVRELDELSAVLQRYATRYEALRRQLLQRSYGIMEWAPPDASPLLPKGPIQLTRDDQIDELVDVAELDLTGLLAAARANWAAIGWLSWAAGERRPAIPQSLTAPTQLGAAAALARARHTAALAKMTPGQDPGVDFAWEGIHLSAMSPHLAQVCLSEWEEADRALRWLTDSSVNSPFVIDFEV